MMTDILLATLERATPIFSVEIANRLNIATKPNPSKIDKYIQLCEADVKSTTNILKPARFEKAVMPKIMQMI